MTGDPKRIPSTQKSSPARKSSEDIIRQLEKFPAEVLEAALLVLQMRQAKPQQ